VNSWVSTGQNLPITPAQIKQGLGSDFLSQLAGKAGVSPDAASTQLSGLLPDLIDKLTPNGKMKQEGRPIAQDVLRAHLYGHVEQACPAEELRRQSGCDS